MKAQWILYRAAVLALLATIVGGCVLGPDFQQPLALAVDTYVPAASSGSREALSITYGEAVSRKDAERIQLVHAEAFANQASSLRVLPGAQALLDTLAAHRVPHAIATSGRKHNARHALKLLTLHRNVPVITRDDVRFAKPDPDLFVAAGKRLKVPMSQCVIVGDSVWDLLAARRAFAISVGLLSGGYGREELERAGAYRVYQDPADLLRHLDEVGVRL